MSPAKRKRASKVKKARSAPRAKAQRKYLSQADVPAYSIDEAVRVAEALHGQYAGGPANPIDVAAALPMSPNSGPFKMLTGAAVAYGLTIGGAQAEQIELTELGRRIVAPTEEGDDVRARREALMRPRVIREFLDTYNNSPVPGEQVGRNVLEQMGVPREATERVFQLILSSAEALGLVVEIKGRRYVRMDAAPVAPSSEDVVPPTPEQPPAEDETYAEDEAPPVRRLAPTVPELSNRVFISHGSNKDIVEQIKEILTFGKFEPVVSVERQSTAKPVPDKVMDDMRSCYAGIVHVGTEQRLLDEEGKEHRIFNPNVLIEIGAAMALYHRRFVLLVERGVTLPSNLQGLYEVRYEGERLDHEATMNLLKAFTKFREE